ncbi:MAG: DUF3108 domain-containing protein [Burkholderiaceae bacterium]|nr:DUF3108 domain-containing protein [Burkholderiaceae bacterium]
MTWPPHSPPPAGLPRRRRAWLGAGVLALALHGTLLTVLHAPDEGTASSAAAVVAVQVAPPPPAAPRPAPAVEPAPAPARPVRSPVQTPAEPAETPAVISQATPGHATRLAPAALLSYELRRGPAKGEALLSWRPSPERYEARLERWLDDRPLPAWVSRGGIDGAGLAPLRQTDERGGRARRATNFQREAGKISFSGSSQELPLPAGAQDRLSWMLQLAAIVAADPQAFAPGESVLLPVAARQGQLQTWRFVVQAPQTLELPVGRVESAVFLQRLPEGPYEPQIDIWLDPQRHFLPVRLRWSRDNSEQALEMSLNKELATP